MEDVRIPVTERDVAIPCGEDVALRGLLSLPEGAQSVVLFAHGSGSSRLSPRNQHVASRLHEGRFGTLLFDLLTEEEERIDVRSGALRFEVELLAERLAQATRWVSQYPGLRGAALGYFGASTGAAAALVAAARLPGAISAVVSRGGRPDLAGAALGLVSTPTLLIVGGNDVPVIGMNEEALHAMTRAEARLAIVPDASHLFEEPGALDRVADLAMIWFARHLGVGRRPSPSAAASEQALS